MSAGAVLAIDAGTGSARALAIDLGTGEVRAQAVREWSHPPLPGHPGGTVFETAGGWEAVAGAIAEVVRQVGAEAIRAVAASSMREGFVLLDAAGRELWACPNTDGRAGREAAELTAEGGADRIYAVAGDWVSITAPARLRWLRRHEPAVLDRAAHLFMLGDWVAFRLSGVVATEPTAGSSSALFDLASRAWSHELARLAGVDAGILAPVVDPGTVLGGVTARAAAATGLRVGTPVVAGGADTQLALHALDLRPGTPIVVAGTFWQTAAVTTTPVVDPRRRLRTLCHVEPGTWMIEGIGFLSGLAMRWARDGLAPGRAGRADAYDALEAEAAAIPRGANGVRAVLGAPMQADAWHHPAPGFLGIDLGDPAATGRGALARAVEEAAAYVAAEHLDVLAALGTVGPGPLVLTGGSSAGRLWPTIIAEATGREVVRSPHPQATSHGAARLAASALGEQLAPLAPEPGTVTPDPAGVAAYAELRAGWLRMEAELVRATVAAGLAPLFDPPGAVRPAGSPREDTHARAR